MPMRSALSIIAISCLILIGNGQSSFMRKYAKGYEGHMVREASGNNYVVAGGTDLYMNWHWHMLSPLSTTHVHLFKTDVAGNLLWERIHSRADARTIATWMEPAPDGGFIVTGHANHDMTWPPDSNDVLLIKTDALGHVTWSRIYDSGKDELAHCVQPTSDGGYVISGFHDAAPVSATGTTHVLLIKTDPLGNVQWERLIDLAIRDFITGEPFSYVVRQLADGGYAIVGTAIGATALGVYVIRTDGTGSVQWARVYSHQASVLRYSTGRDLIEAANGDLLIAGSMDKSQPVETNYPYALRLAATGALLDARFYETAPMLMFQSGFSSVMQTADGGFFFNGMGGYGEFGDQAQLLKTDPDLDQQWSRVYTWDGLATMGSRSGRLTSDGGYILTGKRQFAGTVLLKTDHEGLIPCKVPNTLVELLPDLVMTDVSPGSTSGLNGNPIPFATVEPMVDVSDICPLINPLPIELIDFTATPLPSGHVLLKWSAAAEADEVRFIVERSVNAASFHELVSLSGNGSAMERTDYEFTDRAPLATSVAYYRLKQLDEDGRVDHSAVLAVAFPGEGLEVVHASLDRASRTLQLELRDSQSHSVELTVTDALGRSLARESVVTAIGVSRVVIGLADITAGTYAISIRSASEMRTVRAVLD